MLVPQQSKTLGRPQWTVAEIALLMISIKSFCFGNLIMNFGKLLSFDKLVVD